MDLSQLTAPPFILSPTSLVEYSSYWAEVPTLLSITRDGTAEDRILAVTNWVLSTFIGQFTAREKATGTEKKPLNPFLGEQFKGKWSTPEGEITLVSEQVSHHPPITAYHIDCPAKGISFQGHCAQKTSFSAGTITVRQIGHSLLRVQLTDGTEETFLVTLPKLSIAGLIYGKPYVELADSSSIQSSSGYTVQIDYKGKGYFSGKAHTFVAHITSPTSAPLYTVEGQWTDVATYTAIAPAAANSQGKKVGDVFANFGEIQRQSIEVAPIEQMGEFESRRVWKDVSEGIRAGDFDKASVAKTKIETSERQKRKDETAAGTPFQTRLFTTIADDPVYHKLAALCHHKPLKEESFAVIKS